MHSSSYNNPHNQRLRILHALRTEGDFKMNKPPVLTDEMIIAGEIEALENAINNPRDREDYMSDFFSNADVLLRAMKALQKGDKQDGQGKDYPRAS